MDRLGDLHDTQVIWSEWLHDNDPVEALAEQTFRENINEPYLPEGLTRELVSCFSTHRENRQKLARAVQARGYYVKGKSKGKGKSKSSSKGGKSKGRGKGGKARSGLSLEELKAKTTCAECGQPGHWKNECPRKAHVTTINEADETYEETGDYSYDYADENYDEWDDEAWDRWAEYEQTRTSNVVGRSTLTSSKASSSVIKDIPTKVPPVPAPVTRLRQKAFDAFTPEAVEETKQVNEAFDRARAVTQ